MRREWIYCVSLVVVLVAMCVGPTSGQQQMTGEFSIALGGDMGDWNVLVQTASGGTGWNGNQEGPWFPYAQSVAITDDTGNLENLPRFWNQWFYDGVYDPTRYKIVDITFNYRRVNVNYAGWVGIWVNWSTPQWSALGMDRPPLSDFGPNGEPYLGRDMVDQLRIGENPEYLYGLARYRLKIPYNPEWVSIDVRGYNASISNGILIHECVPEPGGLIALACGLGGLGGLFGRWFKRPRA